MRKRSSAIIAAVLAAGLSIGLCGCEGQLPTPVQTSSTNQTSPVLTAKQEKKIRTGILSTLNQCNQNLDVATLGSILEGPELDIRTSELNVARATIPTDLAQTVISTDSGWPRTVFSITTTTEDQQSKRLLVLKQDSARQNYKLWGVARLFSGVKMPSFEVSQTGSAQGTPTDTGLVMTPKAAVAAYADLLQNGANSKFAGKFADDDLRTKLAELTDQVQKARYSRLSMEPSPSCVPRMAATWWSPRSTPNGRVPPEPDANRSRPPTRRRRCSATAKPPAL
mgnify:CR=1 FL=1